MTEATPYIPESDNGNYFSWHSLRADTFVSAGSIAETAIVTPTSQNAFQDLFVLRTFEDTLTSARKVGMAIGEYGRAAVRGGLTTDEQFKLARLSVSEVINEQPAVISLMHEDIRTKKRQDPEYELAFNELDLSVQALMSDISDQLGFDQLHSATEHTLLRRQVLDLILKNMQIKLLQKLR